MNNYRLVSDSACDLLEMDNCEFALCSLRIIVGDKEFVDNKDVDLGEMQNTLDEYKGKTSTACPGPGDWIEAFGEAENVFCVTITSGLSGSCSSANAAKQMYESEHPNRKVYIIDTLSTGPENTLIVKKLAELLNAETNPDEVYRKICEYKKKTHLAFSLVTVNNLAKNGRINSIIAKGIDILDIRILGQASRAGTLEILNKSRGDKKLLNWYVDFLKKNGYTGGRIIIGHNCNPEVAIKLRQRIEEEFGVDYVAIQPTRALDSYYAEPGALLLGFEGSIKN